MLVTTDLHLTDNPSDYYRFEVFDALLNAVEKNEDIVICGDLADKKDKHSGGLVNEIIHHLKRLTQSDSNSRVYILCGNHDQPVEGPPYWSFLSEIPGIKFILTPWVHNKMVFFPHSKDTLHWPRLIGAAGQIDVVFMHQTVTGAVSDNGRTLTGDVFG